MTANNYVVDNGYIVLPVTTNPKTIYQNAVKAINTLLTGWIPRESQLDNILLEQFAAMTAEAANVAAAVPESIFAYFGALIGITPLPGSMATALTTWTMVDTQGYTIPAGTTVGYQVLGNQLLTFTTTTAFTITVGQTQAHTVSIRATGVGTAYNGLTPSTYSSLVLVSPALTYIRSITPVTKTSGGATPEQLTAYLNRLSYELQLLTPRPILPNDFAVLARNVTGVYRAVAYNNLNPFANLLSTEDATFVGGTGSWTAISGCTIADTGSPSLKITAAGSVNAVVESGTYAVPQNAFCEALLSMDHTTHLTPLRQVQLSVLCYDINNTLLSTNSSVTTSIVTPVSGAFPVTFVRVDCTTPTNTTHVRLRLTVKSPGATEHQYVLYPGLFLLNTAPINFVPNATLLHADDDTDTDTQHILARSWYYATTAFLLRLFATNQYNLSYTGTGTSSGATKAYSSYFYLPAGRYYASAYIDATNVFSGHPEFQVRSGLSSIIASDTQTPGQKSTIGATFRLTAPAMITFIMNTNTCTVTSGLPLTFGSPFVATGTAIKPWSPGPLWGFPNLIYNNARTVTVAVVDKTGTGLDATTEAAVAAYLDSLREVNFIVNVIGPSYTTIDVTWAGFVTTAVSLSSVSAAATEALRNYLSPAFWGGGTQTPPIWRSDQNIVRYLEVATVLGETPGLTLTTLTIGYHGGSLGTSNLPLTGFAPLPKVGTINASVVAE